MAAKSVQRHAGAVWAVIAFLLLCGFHIPSAQAANKITIDGIVRGTTLGNFTDHSGCNRGILPDVRWPLLWCIS